MELVCLRLSITRLVGGCGRWRVLTVLLPWVRVFGSACDLWGARLWLLFGSYSFAPMDVLPSPTSAVLFPSGKSGTMLGHYRHSLLGGRWISSASFCGERWRVPGGTTELKPGRANEAEAGCHNYAGFLFRQEDPTINFHNALNNLIFRVAITS